MRGDLHYAHVAYSEYDILSSGVQYKKNEARKMRDEQRKSAYEQRTQSIEVLLCDPFLRFIVHSAHQNPNLILTKTFHLDSSRCYIIEAIYN